MVTLGAYLVAQTVMMKLACAADVALVLTDAPANDLSRNCWWRDDRPFVHRRLCLHDDNPALGLASTARSFCPEPAIRLDGASVGHQITQWHSGDLVAVSAGFLDEPE